MTKDKIFMVASTSKFSKVLHRGRLPNESLNCDRPLKKAPHNIWPRTLKICSILKFKELSPKNAHTVKQIVQYFLHTEGS
jgi:hypothetical protein